MAWFGGVGGRASQATTGATASRWTACLRQTVRMDAWIGVVGTLLGGGVAYLNGTRDRKLEARRDQEKRVTEVAGELLQIVDARERYVHGYLEVVGEFPHDGTPDGEEDPARKTLALLELYAPAPVTTAAREYVDLMDKWEAGWTWEATGNDVRAARERYISALRAFIGSDNPA